MGQATPGPWISEHRKEGGVVIRAGDDINRPVAEIWYNGHDPVANGALVAAAPDLLAFAEKVVGISDTGGDVIAFLVSLRDLSREGGRLIIKARGEPVAAIAKAEGPTHSGEAG